MALLVGIVLAIFVFPAPWDGAVEIGEAALWWRWSHRRRPAVGGEAEALTLIVGTTDVPRAARAC